MQNCSIEEGIYYDMPGEEYYNSDALGSSRLKAFTESPLHYLKYKDMEDTPALQFGRAAHCYILEGSEAFNEEYTIMPEGMIRRGKDWESFKARHPAKTFISKKDFKQIVEMRESLLRSDAYEYIDAPGKIEVSLFWEEQGIKCKGRLDKLITGSAIDTMVDYKTCADASVEACLKSMKKYKYWLQEAHYGAGYHQVTGRDIEAIFIFQEKVSPYDVCLVRVADDSSPTAYTSREFYLNSLTTAIKNNDFPGRNKGRGVIDFYLPEI